MEKEMSEATVIYLQKCRRIELAIKGRHIGAGCWNGYGGGLEPEDKTPRDGAIRELKVESKNIEAKPHNLHKIAEIVFHNTKSDGRVFVCKVHFYVLKFWRGQAEETIEMLTPTWFNIDNLPIKEMMPADKYWLMDSLNGKKIKGIVKYGPFQKELLEKPVIIEVDYFDD